MKKAKPLMIQGTMSSAGKSLICTALCRIFREDGYKVAPFKSQNMALNSYITKDGLEMGRAQAVQAQAAKTEPSVLMNPVLLKPSTDIGSQVTVNGKPRFNMDAVTFYEYRKNLIPDIKKAYDRLSDEYDIIVIEGAGSPAEINLKKDDIVNMGVARMTDSPVLLCGDIDRGGVFAQLYGTVSLLEECERRYLKATVINKFRGDVSILRPGLDMLCDLINIPCAGIVPYIDIDIDDEDSLSERFINNIRKEIDIAVIKLPRISNFTDFSVFDHFCGVSLRYVKNVYELESPDLIIIPGTKSTISDLLWLRQNGLEARIKKHASQNKPVFGICGGLQMLGNSIKDPDNTEGGGEICGMGLLDIDTVFSSDKTLKRSKGELCEIKGIFKELSKLKYSGYEIHMGKSSVDSPVIQNGSVYGSYIHGLFDESTITTAIVKALYKSKGLVPDEENTFDIDEYREKQYDKLASFVRDSLDMSLVYRILEEGI